MPCTKYCELKFGVVSYWYWYVETLTNEFHDKVVDTPEIVELSVGELSFTGPGVRIRHVADHSDESTLLQALILQ